MTTSKMTSSIAIVGSLVIIACLASKQTNYVSNHVQTINRVVPFVTPRSEMFQAYAKVHQIEEIAEAENTETEVSREVKPKGMHSWAPMGILSAIFGVLAAFLPKKQKAEPLISVDLLENNPSRRQLLAGGMAGAAAMAVATAAPSPAAAGLFGGSNEASDWEQVYIPDVTGQDFTFYDVTMLDDKRGFLIGSKQLFLETNDGGNSWTPRVLDTQDDLPYRFTSLSFSGDEGWLVGKPAILMHTTNGGRDWQRVSLSPKLPGIPILIHALNDQGAAEMCTDQGGLYTTTNAAQTWKAEVEETVDATLNRTVSSGISGASYYTGSFGTIARSDDGKYIGVSSRGNFFMTWEPGQTFWMPHNRAGARRIQSMGWRRDGGIWEIGRGGQLSFGKGAGIQEEFDQLKINSRGFGLLDVGWRSDEEVWTTGGSGTLIKSTDAGQSWKRQRDLDDIAANLYEVKFFNNGNTGFVLGNGGVLLRYVGRQ